MGKKMTDSLNTSHLKKITNELIETITSDEFLNRMREVRNAPEGERMRAAAAFLSIDALRSAGLEIPKDLRVASRYFEEGAPAEVSPTTPGMRAAGSSGSGQATPLGVCAGGGVDSVCGCAGNTVILANK